MTRPRRIAHLLFAACCLVSIGGLIFLNRGVIAQQLQNWQVIPQPERLTELYFTDYAQLPQSLAASSSHSVSFTVRNLEHRQTTYHYKIVAVLPVSGTEQHVGEGTFLLEHNKTQLSEAAITVPALEPRISIRVDLYYESATSTKHMQTQSINYWAAITGLETNKASL